jgi:maltose alpha-D-glucosyltransferase / alpha-amylase
LSRTPPIPDNCQWCTFLRNHDELTLEMVTPQERQWMWDQYAPEPRMRLNLGIRRRLAPLMDNDLRKIELIHSLLFTLPGSPIIYYGDEIGMGDNVWLPDRNGVRTPMQWDSTINAGFSDGPSENLFLPVIKDELYEPGKVNVINHQQNPASLWNTIRNMLLNRKLHRSFGVGEIQWVDCQNDRIAAFHRRTKEESVLTIHNLNDAMEVVHIENLNRSELHEILTDQRYEIHGDRLSIELQPYQFLWFEE